jgi:3'(2'), 5'-bisphosphate nucleotidase
VALPGLDVVLDTESVPAPAPRDSGAPIRIAVSRTRAPALVQHVAASVGAELVPMGSAGYKVSAVVRGEVDAYVHSGGQYEWDSAAPVAVARAAGLHTSRIDGSELRYNAEDVYLPDLLVCRSELAAELLAAIASAPAAEPAGDSGTAGLGTAQTIGSSRTDRGAAAPAAAGPQEGTA